MCGLVGLGGGIMGIVTVGVLWLYMEQRFVFFNILNLIIKPCYAQ